MASPRKPEPAPFPNPIKLQPELRQRVVVSPWDQATKELAELDAGLPVALLPVRIETRFIADHLVVRVYPDGLHADSLKHSLTAAEYEHAKAYWIAAGAEAAADKLTAWRVLIDAVGGSWRAAWVMRATRGDVVPARDEREAVTALRLLPRRWVVVGTLHGKELVRAAGREIPADLMGGVDLNMQATSADSLLLQPATRWVVDLEQAIIKGMALRIPLTGEAERVRTDGLDTLLVFGASAGDASEQRLDLEALLAAHHYSRGIGFLAQGEPTNREEQDADLLRPDAARLLAHEEAVHSAEVAAERARRRGERAPGRRVVDAGDDEPFEAFNGAVGPALAKALGIDAARLGALEGAADREQLLAGAMNTAIWPVTGGALLWQLRDKQGKPMLEATEIAELRAHFIANVRGAGPLATLRVGSTPYGFLPVCALPRVAEGTDLHTRMQSVLHRLLGHWQKAAAGLPTVDSSADDTTSDLPPEDTLVEVLASQPWPTRFAVRRLDAETPMAKEAAKAKPAPSGSMFRDYVRRLNLIFSAGLLVDELPLGRYSPHPVLCDYEENVVAWGRGAAKLPHTYTLRDAIRRDDDDKSPDRRVALPGPVVSLLDQIVRIGRDILLDAKHPASAPDRSRELKELDAAVTVLRSMPEADGERILGQSLSLAATRLDAWITATATRRLAALRVAKPSGLQVGAWGVVHGLRPAKNVPPGGYALAPSLAQAAAAVALRSGHAAYSTNGSSPYAVDLSSERVRLARWLYDGVRQGQSLGVLLGQRYERLLHEHGADTLVRVTREAALTARDRDEAPVHVVDGLLVARALAPVGDPTAPEQKLTGRLAAVKALVTLGDAVTASIKGLKSLRPGDPLHTRPLAVFTPGDVQRLTAGVEPYLTRTLRRIVAIGGARPTATLASPGINAEALGKIAVEPLLDALDALADTATFETTHRLLAGDRSAAGTVLAAVDRGEAPPPELLGLETPRAGVTVSHRVLLLLPAQTAGGGWFAGSSAAAMAEPRLECWAAGVLGAPDKIRVIVERRDALTGALRQRERVDLGAIVKLSALDFCRLSAEGPWRDGPLAARVQVERVAAGAVDERITLADDEDLAAGQLGLAEAHAIAASLASSWRGGRSATSGELSPLRPPGDPEPLRALDRSELKGRVDRLKDWLGPQKTRLATLAQGARADLLRCFRELIAFGVPALASPTDIIDEPVEQLRGRVAALQVALAPMLAALASASDLLASAGITDGEALASASAALCTVTGDVPVLPLYKAARGVARSPFGEVLQIDEATISGWFAQLSRVRPRIDALDASLRLAEARHERPPFTLRAGQLGSEPDAAWAATHRPPGDRPCLCITAVLVPGAAAEAEVAALAIDAWSERVPARDVLGGLALQFQSPAAQAPQVVLLATPSPNATGWSLAELQRAAASAFPLARIRSVTPDRLENFGHLLPCIFLDGARVPIDTGGGRFFDVPDLVARTKFIG